MTDSHVIEMEEVHEQQQLPAPPPQNSRAPLFQENERTNFWNRWYEIQGSFVDEPRRAVEQADQLVDSVVKRLSEVFTNERNNMEQTWSKGGDVSTEDLRQALQRYRSFFDRLLTV